MGRTQPSIAIPRERAAEAAEVLALAFARDPLITLQAQGQGYGQALLDAVQARSEAHPTSTGVALDTELATNVAIYERCSYHGHTTAKLDSLVIGCMFRPNRPAVQREAVAG